MLLVFYIIRSYFSKLIVFIKPSVNLYCPTKRFTCFLGFSSIDYYIFQRADSNCSHVLRVVPPLENHLKELEKRLKAHERMKVLCNFNHRLCFNHLNCLLKAVNRYFSDINHLSIKIGQSFSMILPFTLIDWPIVNSSRYSICRLPYV